MNAHDLEDWLWTARRDVIAAQTQPDEFWWPTEGNNNDTTTAWATAFFVTAARSMLGDVRALTLNKSGTDAGQEAGRVVERLWKPTGAQHVAGEMLVDFSINDWASANPIKLTAESEADATQPLEDWRTVGRKSHSWDFFKLLVVPSPIRLFFSRVGGSVDRLCTTLAAHVTEYGATFLRPEDQLGCVIIPRAKESAHAGKTTVLCLQNGMLHVAAVGTTPRVWKGKL